jgi:predicted RNA-binding Zn ribbon-like protein
VTEAAKDPTSGADLPFKYVAGDPSLDLVNTVDWTRRGPERERLTDYERLTRWAEGAGVLAETAAEGLRRKARLHPEAAEAALQEALRVRSILRRLVHVRLTGEPDAPAWWDFNDLLATALRRLRIAPRAAARGKATAVVWEWIEPEGRLESMLWPVLRAAADLLTSDEAARIRRCDGPDCGWMYVDRSRNHLRRWCEMETCGTEAKTRRRRERTRRRTGRSRRAG